VAVVFALEKLRDDCVAQFAVDGTFGDPAPIPAAPDSRAQRANPFGWRQANRQGVGARIVWIPGDDPGGNIGALLPPKYPARLDPGRPLATLEELFTCYITHADTTANEDERKQYHIVRLLYDAWIRAVYLAAHGTFRIVSQGWITDKNERRYGAGLRVVGAIQAMIPDETPTILDPPFEADITPIELDVTDSVIVIPAT
jgi:hypothetical protein